MNNGVAAHSENGADNIRIVRKRVSSLKPSPENQELYRSADHDPDIDALAEAIKRNGCDPLVVTADNYIVSGHRRLAALKRIGRAWVVCRVLPHTRDHWTKDQFIALLRDYNHQRHKTVAEQVREELVDINPEEAYRHLQKLRDESVYGLEYNGVKTLEIEGVKKRSRISSEKADHVKYIKQVVFTDRRLYWPLAIRGVYYALLNYDFLRNIRLKLPYKNNDESYHATADLITRLRLNGSIPWEAFTDGTRPLEEFHPFPDVREFIRQELRNLFRDYWRDLLQSQPNYVECVCEKNTIYHMVLRVTRKYQIWTSSGRGFNSIDPWHEMYQRYRNSGKNRLIVILLSDHDPEGLLIPHVGGRTLRDDFGVEDVTIIKAGVTREQIEKYNLPPQTFAKETSSNRNWFIERNGGDDTVYELEALNPEAMLRDFEDIVKSVLDMSLFNREAREEQQEAPVLQATKEKVIEALKGIGE